MKIPLEAEEIQFRTYLRDGHEAGEGMPGFKEAFGIFSRGARRVTVLFNRLVSSKLNWPNGDLEQPFLFIYSLHQSCFTKLLREFPGYFTAEGDLELV